MELKTATVIQPFLNENRAFQTNPIMFFGEVKTFVGKSDFGWDRFLTRWLT